MRAGGGHPDLVDFMIGRGANDFDFGLEGARQGGHRELADLMIAKGGSLTRFRVFDVLHLAELIANH